MDIKKYIQSKWNFKKSVKENVITFKHLEEQKKKKRIMFASLAIALLGLAVGVFNFNPMLSFFLFIGGISFGSESLFNNASTSYIDIVYLTSTKIAVAFKDLGDSNKGKIIIGDISGDTITYGTETQFEAGDTYAINMCKMDSSHVAIIYHDFSDSFKNKVVCCSISGNTPTVGTPANVSNSASPSNYGSAAICRLTDTKFVVVYNIYDTLWKLKARIGTISGTDITYGDELAILTGASGGYTASGVSICRMSDSQFVVSHSDGTSSKHGQAWVGDVSGTTITKSALYEFTTEKVSHTSIAALTSTKFVIVYQYNASGYKGKAIIGNVSSSTISYGTATAVISGGTFENEFEVVRLSDTKFLLAGKRGSGTVSGVVEMGDVSTDTITMSSETLFNSGSTTMISCDSVSETEFIIAYSDYGNSNKGTAIIGTYSESSAFIPRTMWFN